MIRLLALVATVPAQAGAFDLALPVDCTLGETCFIQQYQDHDPSVGATDFTCGPLSYDAHNGTDFAVPTLAAMAAGVAVLAAAPGTVLGIRDGMRDGPPGPDVKDRECGNGVLIDHGEGWQTQYCHLRQGSVLVRQGDRVETGTRLGLIGQSGLADFPHLHLTLRENGEPRDPFAPGATTCGTTGDDLWIDPPRYAPGGLVGIGFATEVPAYDAIKAGMPLVTLSAQSPAIVLWVHVFGARAGDALVIGITGPNGPVTAERISLDRTQARLFRAIGKRASGKWPLGAYTGEVRLMRGATEIGRLTTITSITP